MHWTVTLLGKTYEVEANETYEAKKQAVEKFKAETGNTSHVSSLILIAKVKRHEDKRIRYDF